MDVLKRDIWYSGALLVALAGSLGSVWLSLGMHLNACPLCFYQRVAVFLTAAILILGLVASAGVSRGTVAWLALPGVLLGLGVAAFHVSLEMNGTLECPKGLFELGTAPQQSLALFLLLLPPVLISALREPAVGWGRIALAAGVGALAFFGSIKSNPPFPPAPKEAYKVPPVTCRPPFPG